MAEEKAHKGASSSISDAFFSTERVLSVVYGLPFCFPNSFTLQNQHNRPVGFVLSKGRSKFCIHFSLNI
jgi:hypothetical protein